MCAYNKKALTPEQPPTVPPSRGDEAEEQPAPAAEEEDVHGLLIHRCDIYRRSYVPNPLSQKGDPHDDLVASGAACRFQATTASEAVGETAEVMQTRYNAILAGSLTVDLRHGDKLRNIRDRKGEVLWPDWYEIKAIAPKGEGRLRHFVVELEQVK